MFLVPCFLFLFLFPVSCFLFPVSCFLFPVPCSLFPVPFSLCPVPSSQFPVPCSSVPLPSISVSCSLPYNAFPLSLSLFSVLCFQFSVPCSPLTAICSLLPVPCCLFSVDCCLFPVPRSLFLFPVLYSLFLVYRSLFSHFLIPKFKLNKAIQTNKQTSPSFPGCRTLMLKSCCFIQFPSSTFASLCARKLNPFCIFSSTFIFVSLFLLHIYPFPIFLISYMHKCYLSWNYAFMLRVSVFIIKMTISSIVIGLKYPHFFF